MITIRWKVLILSLAAQFVLSALLHLGVKTPAALKIFDLSAWKITQAEILKSNE